MAIKTAQAIADTAASASTTAVPARSAGDKTGLIAQGIRFDISAKDSRILNLKAPSSSVAEYKELIIRTKLNITSGRKTPVTSCTLICLEEATEVAAKATSP